MLIENSNFLLKEIPRFNPLSGEYLAFWRSEKRSCIEGYWCSGKWMPGPLYFYINFWHIKLKKDRFSKTEIISRPFLRDLEWDKQYVFAEARGFSGFSKDDTYSCYRALKTFDLSNPSEVLPKSCYKPDKSLKTYIEARNYLRKNHSISLGKPLYENEAKNVIDIESRGTGKSYLAASNIAHNFLFDGATDYDEYLLLKSQDKPLTSETLVGAVDAKYSKDLLSKVELGLKELPGSIKYNNKLYPCPLLQEYTGSLAPGKYLEAQREVKIGSNWDYLGSHSKLHHRTFGDNDFAGNGTRPGVSYLEEIGFFVNYLGAMGALKECTANGSIKFGTIWGMGTGGAMDSGATLAAKTVFDDPESWDCLVFPDPWEGKPKIGYFIPATHGLNEFKDSEGITDEPRAKAFLEKERTKASKAKSKKPLNDELQNRPLKPSEAFLVTKGNRFPIKDLQAVLANLEANEKYRNAEWVGDLIINEQGKVEWKINTKLKGIINFPLTKDDEEDGAIVIFEMPYEDEFGEVPFGRYLAGNDPYDQSKSEYTDSLGSTFIYDKLTKRIVAEYTGRPETYKHYYENVRRLLKFYNARCLYENERKGLFDYFESKSESYLLLDQPLFIKDIIKDSRVERGKGIHMTSGIKDFGEELINTWLIESAEDQELPELLNMYKIRSIPLLKELIAYNEEGNFDRVMSFMMVMFHIQEVRKIKAEERKTQVIDIRDSSFWNKRVFQRTRSRY